MADTDSEYETLDSRSPRRLGKASGMMLSPSMRSDAGQGDINGPGKGDYTSVRYTYKSFTYEKYHWYAWKGAPAWKDNNGDLHIGDSSDVPLFDYNPNDIDEFECPFVETTNSKGVLCNWFAGCEPVSNVLAKLFRDGFFQGFPYSAPVGYMFRGSKYPKLVLVYSNEFDNELYRASTSKVEAQIAVPGIDNNQVTISAQGMGVGNQRPLDPYCFRYLHEEGEDSQTSTREFNSFLTGLGYDNNIASNIQDAANWMNDNILPTRVKKYQDTELGTVTKFNGNKKPNTEVKTYAKGRDLRKRAQTKVLSLPKATWDSARKVLMDEQVDGLLDNHRFPGISNRRIEQDYAQTLGFYELRRVVSGMSNPVNTFLFTTNADVPSPIQFST